jgi:alpha-galactosidase
MQGVTVFSRAVALSALLIAIAGSGANLSGAAVVRAGSASISNDPEAGTWTIRSGGTALTIAGDAAHDFRLVRLAAESEEPRNLGAADTQINVGGRTLSFGSRAAGFVFQNAEASADRFTVRLSITFDLAAFRLRTTRHYAAASGSPTFETWTSFLPLGAPASVSDLNAFMLTIPNGTIHWVNGLQGDGTEANRGSAFTLQQRALAAGERLVLGSPGRASEQTVPSFAVTSGSDVFYGGLLWSGAWSMTATAAGSGLVLRLGLPSMSTAVSSAIDGPHAYFGLTTGGLGDAAAALRTFALRGLRAGRPLDPQVTYNTWFAYGVAIDESSMRPEIDGAARVGAERFVVDAGWYAGAGREGVGDFGSGLGTWQVDPSRFPSGLGALSDYAHDRGLTFGLWVEPERVALSTIGRSGLAQEGWLAKTDGKYGSSAFAQVCFGGPAARQWVFDRLTTLIDAARPDYLKWDNNFWINCDRSGHVHGTSDGNFAHVRGLYEVLARLRERYPDLAIENVSGGGNRMDLGMLRYTDAGWMDDRTTPSVKVRHNVQGLSAVFPPAYLMSFVMHDADEPLRDAQDLPLIFRSRMTGLLGLSFRTGDLSDDEVSAMRQEINRYKSLREALRSSSATLLTSQAGSGGGAGWDVWQTTPEGIRPIVIWGFQTDTGARRIAVRPAGLHEQVMYEVQSADAGPLGFVSGAELMEMGVELSASPQSAAHLILLTPIRQR